MSLRSGAIRGPRPFTRWHVAHCALAFEERPPACRVADARPTPAVGSKPARMKAMHARDLRRLQRERRHAGAGAPLVITRREILVGLTRGGTGRGAGRRPTPDRRSAVALRALGAVEHAPRGDVRLAVLAGVILREQLCTGRRCQEDCDEGQQPRALGHLATLYTRFTALSTVSGQRSVRL